MCCCIPHRAKCQDFCLSFAVAPNQIPYKEIITVTEATARRLDQKSANVLRLGVSAVLQQTKPPSTQFNSARLVAVSADKGKAMVIMDKLDCNRKMMEILNAANYTTLRCDRIASALKCLWSDDHLVANAPFFLPSSDVQPTQDTQRWNPYETHSIHHWFPFIQACQGVGQGPDSIDRTPHMQ